MRSALVLTAAMAVALVASARLARSEDADWLKLAKQGSSHYTLSDYPQAIRCWERAAKLNPQAWAVQANLAKAYLQLARYRDALAASERAIAIGMPPVSAGNELGHAIGGLDDEYADPSVMGQFPDYGPAEERGHPNTTREANAKRAKWHYWLLPPALPADEAVGCVEGGWFREKGYFHPARTCRMRASGAKKYCAVCLEQVELSFYSRIEPVDDVSVRVPDVLLWKGDATRLSATAIAIAAGREKLGGFTARWYVDDRPAPASAVSSGGVKTELNLPALKLPPGPHEAVVRIDLRDARIRRDGGLLSSLRAWRVNVADGPAPKIVAPGRITAVRGAPVMFDVAVEGGTPETRAVVWGLPGSSMFPCADRVERVVWCPPRNARGIFPVTISIGKGEAAVKHTTEVVLLDPAHQVSPVFRDQGVVLATRGKELILRLEAFDADGDGLCFSAKKLPPGATLEARTGVLRWTPGWSTPFDAESDVVVRVSDGLAEDEISFKMIVTTGPWRRRPGRRSTCSCRRAPRRPRSARRPSPPSSRATSRGAESCSSW